MQGWRKGNLGIPSGSLIDLLAILIRHVAFLSSCDFQICSKIKYIKICLYTI